MAELPQPTAVEPLDAHIVAAPSHPRRLLVLVHGYGEPVDDLTDRLALLDPDGRHLVVAPRAPFEHRGRAIWHRAMTSGELADRQFLASLAAIDALLGRLEHDHGLAASEAVVGGFSQGGGLGIALLLAADVRHRPAAAFGICSFAPHVQGLRVDLSAAAGRPCLVTSARRDHFAPIDACRASAGALVDAGLDLTYGETDSTHVVTDEAAALAGGWLASLDGGPAPERGTSLLDDTAADRARATGLWEPVG